MFRRMQDSGALDPFFSWVRVQAPWVKPCGLLQHKEYLLVSDRVVGPIGISPGVVFVRGDLIHDVRQTPIGSSGSAAISLVQEMLKQSPGLYVADYGSAIIGPGLIDVHVHMNEPGREEWEGVEHATKAAAAGGITTVVDMPLNSHPPATTVAALKQKIKIIQKRNKMHVDVAFWAGLVPQNARDPKQLRQLIKAGALGFKAFMCPSGIDEFPNVSIADIEAALPVIRDLDVPLLIHAELIEDSERPADSGMAQKDVPGDLRSRIVNTFIGTNKAGIKDHRHYKSWAASRPEKYEHRAVEEIIDLLHKLKDHPSKSRTPVPYSPMKRKRHIDFRVHIVHVSHPQTLEAISQARSANLPITAETCPHYLYFAAEDIGPGQTQFKCSPPIRGTQARSGLWGALKSGDIFNIASDHSPSTPQMKTLHCDGNINGCGNFTGAWGGISSLQHSLPATWEVMRNLNMSPDRLHHLWAHAPASLSGLSDSKGSLRAGKYADITIWEPESLANTSPAHFLHRHKLSPYLNRTMRGKVLATFVRGSEVYTNVTGGSDSHCGRIVRRKV